MLVNPVMIIAYKAIAEVFEILDFFKIFFVCDKPFGMGVELGIVILNLNRLQKSVVRIICKVGVFGVYIEVGKPQLSLGNLGDIRGKARCAVEGIMLEIIYT